MHIILQRWVIVNYVIYATCPSYQLNFYMKCKWYPRIYSASCCHIVWGIHWSFLYSLHKVPVIQNFGVSLLLAWTNCWANSQMAVDLRWHVHVYGNLVGDSKESFFNDWNVWILVTYLRHTVTTWQKIHSSLIQWNLPLGSWLWLINVMQQKYELSFCQMQGIIGTLQQHHMSIVACQIIANLTVYLIVCSSSYQRKPQSLSLLCWESPSDQLILLTKGQ